MNVSNESPDQEGDEENEISEKTNAHENQQCSEEVLFSTETENEAAGWSWFPTGPR